MKKYGYRTERKEYSKYKRLMRAYNPITLDYELLAGEINAFIKQEAPKSGVSVEWISSNFFELNCVWRDSFRFWRKKLESKFNIFVFRSKFVYNRFGYRIDIV